jgi:hypothetical protein
MHEAKAGVDSPDQTVGIEDPSKSPEINYRRRRTSEELR